MCAWQNRYFMAAESGRREMPLSSRPDNGYESFRALADSRVLMTLHENNKPCASFYLP